MHGTCMHGRPPRCAPAVGGRPRRARHLTTLPGAAWHTPLPEPAPHPPPAPEVGEHEQRVQGHEGGKDAQPRQHILLGPVQAAKRIHPSEPGDQHCCRAVHAAHSGQQRGEPPQLRVAQHAGEQLVVILFAVAAVATAAAAAAAAAAGPAVLGGVLAARLGAWRSCLGVRLLLGGAAHARSLSWLQGAGPEAWLRGRGAAQAGSAAECCCMQGASRPRPRDAACFATASGCAGRAYLQAREAARASAAGPRRAPSPD
jgi:hypothetical protein